MLEMGDSMLSVGSFPTLNGKATSSQLIYVDIELDLWGLDPRHTPLMVMFVYKCQLIDHAY